MGSRVRIIPDEDGGSNQGQTQTDGTTNIRRNSDFARHEPATPTRLPTRLVTTYEKRLRTCLAAERRAMVRAEPNYLEPKRLHQDAEHYLSEFTAAGGKAVQRLINQCKWSGLPNPRVEVVHHRTIADDACAHGCDSQQGMSVSKQAKEQCEDEVRLNRDAGPYLFLVEVPPCACDDANKGCECNKRPSRHVVTPKPTCRGQSVEEREV